MLTPPAAPAASPEEARNAPEGSNKSPETASAPSMSSPEDFTPNNADSTKPPQVQGVAELAAGARGAPVRVEEMGVPA